MQTKLDNIVKTALARPSLLSVDKEELLMLTHEFPYAPILQFLYTKRLQQSQDPRFGDSVTKTALFFNNPHWLYQQLRDNTPAELVRNMEESSLHPSDDTLPQDTLSEARDDDDDAITDLTSSEQAFIDSITEATDGSLIKDDAAALAEETAENESEGQSLYDRESSSDDTSTEDSLVSYADEDLDLIESSEMESEYGSEEEEHQTSAVVDSVSEEITEESAATIVESTSTDFAPHSDEVIEPETESTTSLSEALSTTEVESTEEVGQEFLVSGPEITTEPTISVTPVIPSLITVISSVGSYDDHPIHTIGIDRLSVTRGESLPVSDDQSQPDSIIWESAPLFENLPKESVVDPAPETESDNDDDSSIQTSVEPQEPSTEITVEAEADNDDDSAVFQRNESFEYATQDPIGSGNIQADEPFSSGLENMGFLPETLLEESDAADTEVINEGAGVYTSPTSAEGWDAFQFVPENTDEEEDHPDATDPDEAYVQDEEGPFINHGDLIKMAGLDQHHETELSFEPLHLTDYFASVGVRLPLEEQPDVFGRQSRSFTGWIKSMKRIQPEKNPVAAPFSQSESELIRADAEQSNEQEEVLTETMANIYALQGLTHKAIDIYEKLSLLNPDKSAIFAAKLSELKGKLP